MLALESETSLQRIKQMDVFHDETLKMSEFLEGAEARFIHSENITLAEWRFKANVNLPEHSHNNEQITKIISGEFELTLDGEKILLKTGSSVIIPPNAVHSGRAITECHIIDVFNPVREDFKSYGE